MRHRTRLSPSPSINQQVLLQCKTICESKTFNKAEEAHQKKGGAIRATKVEKARLSSSEANRRLLELLVNAWVAGERLTDLEIRKRWDLTNMDPEDSAIRKRKQQLRRALETYYLGTQYDPAEGARDSIEIGLRHGFKIDVWSRKDVPQQASDVLATYPHVPANDICARIDSPDCAHIRVCLTGLVELVRWKPRLIDALKRTVTMEFVLSYPKSEFVDQRAVSLSHSQSDALDERATTCRNNLRSLLTSNRETLKEIVRAAEVELQAEHQPATKLGKFTLRWTNGWIPLPYAQIDDAIYVGGFWRDNAVADGPFFRLDASSSTGKFLNQQFGKVWDTAMEDNLLEADLPTMKEDLLISAS